MSGFRTFLQLQEPHWLSQSTLGPGSQNQSPTEGNLELVQRPYSGRLCSSKNLIGCPRVPSDRVQVAAGGRLPDGREPRIARETWQQKAAANGCRVSPARRAGRRGHPRQAAQAAGGSGSRAIAQVPGPVCAPVVSESGPTAISASGATWRKRGSRVDSTQARLSLYSASR
jgi:hypothetical protein